MAKRRWKPETRREIVMKLRAEGKSLNDVATYLGVGKATVCRDLNAWFAAVSLPVSNDDEMRQGNETGKVTQ